MSNDKHPHVSILTPTWNRADYLSNVWAGLNSQTNKSIEWIIANDGSNDETVETVKALAEKSDFPLTLINASVRIGKSRMDNEAVRCARGDFILWCDSDDVLMPNAVETLLATWNSIPEHERDDFSGITALCESKMGVLDNIYPDSPYTDVLWNDLFFRMKNDFLLFARADLLKDNPFLEVDYLIPETSVWNKLGKHKTRYIPVALKFVNYGSANCISFSGVMEYNRGRAYAMAQSKPFMNKSIISRKLRIWRFVTYFRYCIHGDIDFKSAMEMWGSNINNYLALPFVFPLAYAISIKDKIQGKVIKTHKDYLRAERVVEISREYYNGSSWSEV